MTNDLRGYTLKLTASTDMVTETCCNCGVLYAMESEFKEHRRRDRRNFYCPNGHSQVYTGKTDTEKLKDAQARETALQDQLAAAVRESETVRAALLRDRARFANGVCPCCNRSFENVARHMRGQHPDYDITKVQAAARSRFRCSCGRSFESLRGLRTHQGHQRRDGWETSKSAWLQHLTKV